VDRSAHGIANLHDNVLIPARKGKLSGWILVGHGGYNRR
jgi:hypothetical protein